MPVEIEVPTEHLHEMVHEEHHKATGGHGDHGGGHDAKDKSGGNFTMGVALSSAVLAVLAALAALFAGHHANEAMLERVESSDKWSFYQAKGIKAGLLGSKIEILKALDKTIEDKDMKKLDEYKKEQNEIQKKAEELEHSSSGHLERHVTLAKSVTFFQVAIALGAISVLTKRKPLWFVSMAVGAAGIFFMVVGFQPLPPAPEADAVEEHAEHAEKAEGAHAKAEGHTEPAAAGAEHAAVPVPAEKPAEEHK